MGAIFRGKIWSAVWVLSILGALFSSSAHGISSAVNISTRLKVGTADNVAIGGFIINGTTAKKVLIRAVGPSLPVSGPLGDPTMSVYNSAGTQVATNDNWRTAQQDEIIATGLQPPSDKDSAVIVTLNPGAYTAIVQGVNGATGIGLVEVYDLDDPSVNARLGNISTRGLVDVNDGVMIGGFIVRGDISKNVLIRVLGPSLHFSGQLLAGRLMDPSVELYDGSGNQLKTNDNWRTSQQTQIQASLYAPTDDREPALISSLAPGNYTVVVRGVGNTTGLALVEVYDLDQPPQSDGSTLFVAQLTPQNSATSSGSGTGTLRLSADHTQAILTFDYSNLTGPLTGMHIHGPNGEILFDIDSAQPQPDGSYIWNIVQAGSDTPSQIVTYIMSGQTYLNLHTAAYPAGEIKGYFNLSSGAQTAPVPTPPPALPSGTPTASDASRFLTQATFGPTDATIQHVQQVGFDAWLTEQFNTALTSHLSFVDANGGTAPTQQNSMDAWWTYSTTAPDQLRQRLAFALSEFFVVSFNGAGLGQQPVGLSHYYDTLLRDSFTNYRTLLEDVTLDPAMGVYLNMLRNDKASADGSRHPNENYAREIMQLFSIGLYKLNLDGGLTLDSQNFPIPTYSQDDVIGLAAVFTGWTWGQTGTPIWNGAPQNYRAPMVSVPTHHESAAKNILTGVLVPAGQTPQADLKLALDTIFNHPNVGPFFCRFLIERLVTSNPSAGYVYRVASVFNNNGRGVRGDLQAVIRAIFEDYDARGVALQSGQGYGHLREPVLRLTELLRGYGASSPDGKFTVYGGNLAQVPLHAPTVFNFFLPDYEPPGAIAQAGLKSPETEISTETTTITQANTMQSVIYYGTGPSSDKITLNLTNEIALAASPSALADHLNLLFMGGEMSSAMRTTLVNAVTSISSTNPTERAKTAIYLTVNSPEFVVEK